MNRRDFLQILGSVGMAATFAQPGTAIAANPNRHFVFVHAGGGWDPTSLCDPKGNANRSDGRGPVNHYLASEIGSVNGSPIRYAPFPNESLASSTVRDDNRVSSFADFFNDTASNMVVINGIDMETNNHDTGTRTMWSGSEAQTQPALGALIAQAQAPDSPLAFITNGGYDYSDGLIAPTRVSGSGIFQELANPERYRTNLDADTSDDTTFYLHPDVYNIVDAERLRRLESLRNQSSLPQRRAAISQLIGVQTSDNNLTRLINALPSSLSGGLRGQAEVAVAAFQAQVASCANLVAGGFDTHGSTDRNQTFSLANLIDGVHHLWNQVRLAGLADRVTIIVGSDFGRTPYYNDGNGKDHWNITSMLAIGAGIDGNRVVGGTDAHYNTLRINPNTLQPAADQNDPSAIRLTCGHVHHALRLLAGIESDPIARQYALEGGFLPIFG